MTRRLKISCSGLRRMYGGWPFFRSLINNIEKVLAKTDLIVGGRYLVLGRPLRLLEALDSRIREEYFKTRQAILRIKQQEELLEDGNALRQSLHLRNPYLDPIHFIQIRYLRDYRAARPSSACATRMLDLLRSSINDIIPI